MVPPVARDCSTDVSAPLTAWLATVPDGATVDLAGGCYLANGTVWLRGKTGVTLANGTIRATANAPDFTDRAQLAVDLGSGITLRDLTLDGSNRTAD
jgi:hypothetical protein